MTTDEHGRGSRAGTAGPQAGRSLSPPRARGRRRLTWSLAGLVLIALAALPGLYLLATPRIVPADPDPAYPTVPAFAITNPNPLLAMEEVSWYCFLHVRGPANGLQLVPEPPAGSRLEPSTTLARRCINKPVADGQLLVLSFHIKFKLWSFERSISTGPFYWDVEAKQGRWVTRADAPPTSKSTGIRP
jgi:hypothetical protein